MYEEANAITAAKSRTFTIPLAAPATAPIRFSQQVAEGAKKAGF